MIIAISLPSLRTNCDSRPEGYSEDVILHGEIKRDWLHIEESVYVELRAKFGIPVSQPPSQKMLAPIKSVQPVPYPEWPIWAKAFKRFAKPEDKGIGDVVARMIGAENSAAFKAFYLKVTEKTCGCTGRQTRWNAQYPLRTDG